MCWKCETRLGDLPADQTLKLPRTGAPPLLTTPRELMRQGRISGALSLAEVEWAFCDTSGVSGPFCGGSEQGR